MTGAERIVLDEVARRLFPPHTDNAAPPGLQAELIATPPQLRSPREYQSCHSVHQWHDAASLLEVDISTPAS